jgi:putative ABC transport system substrate-binding protein
MRGLGIISADPPGGARWLNGRKPRVAVLNSYNIPPGSAGLQSMRIQGFLQSLTSCGWIKGRDFDFELLDIEERPAMRAAVRNLVAEGVDLIHAFGAPNAMIAAAATSEVPIIYCGAHPEGLGEETLGAGNVTGKVLALPFTATYKNFRFLRRLLPRVRTIHTAFFEDTLYVPPPMRELHAAARDRAGRRVWLSSQEGPVGYRTLAGLGDIIGVEYRELVFAEAGELDRALADIDPATGVFMNYNELLHCPGACDAVLSRAEEMRLPTIFNNNAQAVTLGFLAGIAADWAKLGRQSGEIAAKILAGARPRDFPREIHSDQVSWINLDTAHRLGLELSAEVVGYFDRTVSGRVDTLCM